MVRQLIIVPGGLREDPARGFTSLGNLEVRRKGTRLFAADSRRHGALIGVIQKGSINPGEGALLSRWDGSEIHLVAPF